MNQITLILDDEALEKLRFFMGCRQMTQWDVGPDYHTLAMILLGLENSWPDMMITGAMLDKLEKETK